MDAEENVKDIDQAEDNQVESNDNEDAQKVDTNKIISKLKGRISKEQKSKHDLQQENEALKKQLEQYADLQSGKSIKDLSDEEKAKKADSDKDKRIAELEATIKRNKALRETQEIFTESGLNVSNEVLEMVVADDAKTTLANATAITNLIENVKEATRKELLAGKTPQNFGKPKMTKDEIMGIADPIERRKKMSENWGLFQ
jgi:vacuolar-type H+-ATPase subunit I/STV1